jgi:hypothetical protein
VCIGDQAGTKMGTARASDRVSFKPMVLPYLILKWLRPDGPLRKGAEAVLATQASRNA